MVGRAPCGVNDFSADVELPTDESFMALAGDPMA
jgi:hypothetical protein